MDELLTIMNRISTSLSRYRDHGNVGLLTADFKKIATEYREYAYAGELFLQVASQQFEIGEQAAGFALICAVDGCLQVDNTVTLYLRMAQYWMQKGDKATAKKYLIKLCTQSVDNYEEAIAARDLTDIWESYKHLVAGEVPPSLKITNSTPLAPDSCSMAIENILALPDEELLTAISEHLNELSADGESLSSLNRWEKTVYEIDLMMMEVNSGGFDAYLRYNGRRFGRLKQAVSIVNATSLEALLEDVEQKFPQKKIPKSVNAIENALDVMEERGIDFESEDEPYYSTVERELIDSLTRYIRDNAKRFR